MSLLEPTGTEYGELQEPIYVDSITRTKLRQLLGQAIFRGCNFAEFINRAIRDAEIEIKRQERLAQTDSIPVATEEPWHGVPRPEGLTQRHVAATDPARAVQEAEERILLKQHGAVVQDFPSTNAGYKAAMDFIQAQADPDGFEITGNVPAEVVNEVHDEVDRRTK